MACIPRSTVCAFGVAAACSAASVAFAEGLSPTPQEQAQMFRNAQRQVVHAVEDPDAQVRNLSISKNGSFVCGEVKARRGPGDFPGFERFIDTSASTPGEDGAVDIETDVDDASFQDRWSEYCGD